MKPEQLRDRIWWRNTLIRTYISGLVVLAIGILLWKVVFRYSPWYDILSDPVLASLLTAISIVVLPLILGLMVIFGLNPLLGRWQKWSQLMSFQDRILGELARERGPHIVLIAWPSEKAKTMGVVTAVFPATEDRPEMASVYCPSSPRATSGRLFFAKVADLQFTDWTLNEFQVFNWTLGSVRPDMLQNEHAGNI